MVLNALTTLSLSLLKVMGCSSVSDAHIYMHHVSSVRDWWKKNELGCSWDVQDAQDALKTDPLGPYWYFESDISNPIFQIQYFVSNFWICF